MNAIKAFEDNIEAEIIELYAERSNKMDELIAIDRKLARLVTLHDMNRLHQDKTITHILYPQEKSNADAVEKR